MEDLKDAKLMGIHNTGKEVTQNAKMYYRRHFVDEWVRMGWLEKDGAGKCFLTEKGEVAVNVFYGLS
ncbi:MAG: hypothetical protein Q7J68_07705 [Thermoplasmata archaeon]|nr:hypothetical protein [Thermoplasmata archaeon]